MSFEENEISLKSQGGTEITKRSIAKLIPTELADNFQIIPSRVRDIDEKKIRIYWAHDLAEDPEANHLKNAESRDRFHKIIFSSNWQLNEYVLKLGLPRDMKIGVIETPLEPIPYVEKSKDEVRLIYFSTPQRGLELLIPAFEALVKENPLDNLHLDVFSSFLIYGWDEMDKNFQPLYDKVIAHPNMTYHGLSSREKLIEHLQKAHILAYPSIWPETSCRVLMESMSAGLVCVHPNYAALSDTAGGLTAQYQYIDDRQGHVNMFFHALNNSVRNVHNEEYQKYLKFVKVYADTRFNIKSIALRWETMMKELLIGFPTEESRKLPKVNEQFVYKA
jgi:UDP-glucose:(glucosyl)LPS alpha-1,2-glucosyltransferase